MSRAGTVSEQTSAHLRDMAGASWRTPEEARRRLTEQLEAWPMRAVRSYAYCVNVHPSRTRVQTVSRIVDRVLGAEQDGEKP